MIDYSLSLSLKKSKRKKRTYQRKSAPGGLSTLSLIGRRFLPPFRGRSITASILSLLMVLLIMSPAFTAVAVASDAPRPQSLRPAPVSPPPSRERIPPSERKPEERVHERTEHTKTFQHPQGFFLSQYYPYPIHQRSRDGGWEEIEQINPFSGGSNPLSLCLYASGSAFDQGGGRTPDQMSLTHYTQGGQTYQQTTWLRYPQLRDLIPASATLNSVQVVTTAIDGADPFMIAAYPITQAWNPLIQQGMDLPSYGSTPAANNLWNLAPGTPRAQRSLDITTLATNWWNGTADDFGLRLAIPDPAPMPNGTLNQDLPHLIVKYTVEGSAADPQFGGSYYHDQITPPVLVPGRAVLVHRMGDVDNLISSYVISNYSMDHIIPFGKKTLATHLSFDEVLTGAVDTVPLQAPSPVSGDLYQTYTFPPLSGDPATNGDIYPNYALQVTDPDQDPSPPGLIPSPPFLSQSQPYLYLAETDRHHQVDISALVNTPIHEDEYPNYPLVQFTSVFSIESTQVDPILNPIRMPLSTLPTIETISVYPEGESGELEPASGERFEVPSIPGQFRITYPPGHASITFPGPPNYGSDGCIGIIDINEFSLLDHNSNFDYSYIGNRDLIILPQPDPYEPDPYEPSPLASGIIHRSSLGAMNAFLPVTDPSASSYTSYYNPKVTNMRLHVHSQEPAHRRYELTTATGDISRWFNESGQVTEVSSSIGGQILFSYNSQNPELLEKIEETTSGYAQEFLYDAYDRLVERRDSLNRQVQFAYNAENQIVEYIDIQERSFHFNRDAHGTVTSISLTAPTQPTPQTLITLGYQDFGPQQAPPSQGEDYLHPQGPPPPPQDPRLTSITDACGNTSLLDYNDQERTVTFTDATGRTTTYGFYHDGTLKYIENEEGQRKTFYPDSQHASPATTKELACPDEENPSEEPPSNTYEYDEYRRLIRATNAKGYGLEWEYNNRDKVTVVTDRQGLSTHIEYTQDGHQPLSITAPGGQTLTYAYKPDQRIDTKTFSWKEGQSATYTYTHDANGYIESITDPLQRTTWYDYSSTGQLQQVTDPLGRVTAYTYNAQGQVTQIHYSYQQQEKEVNFTYNLLGQLTTVTDPKGNTTSYSYDACGRIASITDALNETTTYQYNEVGMVTAVTDPLQRLTTYTYNDLHQLIAVTDPAMKSTHYAYDLQGRLISVTNPLGHTTSYAYDKLNRLIEKTDPHEQTTTYTYSPEGAILSVTDPRDNTTTFTYTDSYQLSTVTNPLQETTTYEYYLFGGIKSITNALNQTIHYDYDMAGRLTELKDIQNRTTTFTYDDGDRLVEKIYPGNRVFEYVYDMFDNLLEETNPLNQTTTYTYDLNSNPLTVTTPLNRTYTSTYDALNRLTSTTTPMGHTTYFTYDPVSNLIEMEDPLNHVSSWEYEVRNLLKKSIDALEQESENIYDDARRLVEFQDQLGRSQLFDYDALGRLTEVTSPGNLSTSYVYDAVGNLTEMTRSATTGNNPTASSITQYSYDALSRTTEVISPLSEVTTFAYNELSQLTNIALPGNEWVEHTYDVYNRLSQTQTSDQRSLSYTYDQLDRLSTLSDTITGTYEYEYDVLNRVTEITSPDQRVTALSYDADGFLTQSTYQSQDTDFTYDLDGRLTQIEAPGNRDYQLSYDAADRVLTEALPSGVNHHLTYDELHRPTALSYVVPNAQQAPTPPPSPPSASRTRLPALFELGHLSQSSYLTAILHYQLQEAHLSRIIQQHGARSDEAWAQRVRMNNEFRHRLLSEVTLVSFSPTYNEVSRIVEEEEQWGSTIHNYTYTYDDDDQLLEAVTPSDTYTYTYDERNNRLTQRIETTTSDITETYTYNEADQLLTMTRRDTLTQQVLKEMSYAYDGQGRRIQQTRLDTVPPEITSYVYYAGGNLASVILPDQTTVEMVYDALGHRVKKITDDRIVHYHYSRGELIEEVHEDPITEEIMLTLHYYPWGFTLSQNQVDTDYYYIVDQRGNTRAITDDEGLILETYDYAPFGELLSTSTLPQSRFLSGHFGCQWDETTGLYYMHARYYDATTGRFLTQDVVPGGLTSPISQNRYIYCQNDPVTLIDPTGLTPENTGSPHRASPPRVKTIDMNADPCAVDDLNINSKPELQFTVDQSNDYCVLAYRNSQGEIFIPIDTPAGTVNLVIGRRIGGVDWFYSFNDIIENLRNMWRLTRNPALRQALRGIIDGISALVSGVDGLTHFNLIDAIYQSNLITRELWSDFESAYKGDSPVRTFMRHAIIGGYIASQMGSIDPGTSFAKRHNQDQLKREIGFTVSYIYEIFQTLNPSINLKIHRSGLNLDSRMDLVGIANITLAIFAAEWESRLDPIFGRDEPIGLIDGYNDVGNIHKGTWNIKGERDFDRYLDNLTIRDFTHRQIRRSNRFYNVMASVAILFSKVDSVKTYLSSPDSVFFWLETMRRYNISIGDDGKPVTNADNLEIFGMYKKYIHQIEGRLSSNHAWKTQFDDFEEWLKTIRGGS